MTWKPQTGVPIISARSCAWKKSLAGDCQCWENRSKSNIPLPVGPVCVRRLTQPFTFSPPPYKGLSNGGIHLLGAVVFSCQRTKQLSRGNLTCDYQPRRWYVSRVQWFQMSDALLPGGGQCPFHTILGPASLWKLRLQLQISKLSTHLCGIKQNETHKSSCLRPFCGSRIWSHHPWSCFTHHDAWRQVKGETEDKAGGRGKERKSAFNSSKTAED